MSRENETRTHGPAPAWFSLANSAEPVMDAVGLVGRVGAQPFVQVLDSSCYTSSPGRLAISVVKALEPDRAPGWEYRYQKMHELALAAYHTNIELAAFTARFAGEKHRAIHIEEFLRARVRVRREDRWLSRNELCMAVATLAERGVLERVVGRGMQFRFVGEGRHYHWPNEPSYWDGSGYLCKVAD